jgi:hypothetical protein
LIHETTSLGISHLLFWNSLQPEFLATARRIGIEDTLKDNEEVQKLVTDYLNAVYTYLKSVFDHATKTWNQTAVEFLFRYPHSWSTDSTEKRFEERIQRVGYGLKNKTIHREFLGTDEDLAAAISLVNSYYLCHSTFQKGDVVLVFSATGGTSVTYLALKVIDSRTRTLGYITGDIKWRKPIGIGYATLL